MYNKKIANYHIQEPNIIAQQIKNKSMKLLEHPVDRRCINIKHGSNKINQKIFTYREI